MTGFFLSLLIILTPINQAAFMPNSMLGIPGNNPFNFIWLLALVLVLSSRGNGQNQSLNSYFKPALLLFLTAFIIATLLTAFNIDSLHPTIPSQKPTLSGYYLTYLFKPLQVIITGWLTYKYCRLHGIKTMENAVSLIPVILLPLMMYYFYQGSSGGTDYRTGRDLLTANVGLHANTLGAVAVAILAYNFGKEKKQFEKLDYLSMGCSLLVIVFSLSRMSFIATLVIFLISLKKFTFKQKIISTSLLLIVVLAFMPLLLSRINYGITDRSDNKTQGQAVNANELSAGRVEYIWIPALNMIEENPLLGNGILSIWKGKYVVSKKIMIPSHPHNAYLQVGLDMGIAGIIVFMLLLLSMWKSAKNNFGFKLALITWMIMGITGSTFYPALDTFFIWIMYGISCSMSTSQKKQKAPEFLITK